jgi:hypothetical protein
MYCGYCGKENADDADVCQYCSRALRPLNPNAEVTYENQESSTLVGAQPPLYTPAPPVSSSGAGVSICQVCGYIMAPNDLVCKRCNTPRGMRVDPNSPTPGAYTAGIGGGFINTSGEHGEVPPEIRGGWNWGAFFFNWIWGLNHKTYITLISLVLSSISFTVNRAQQIYPGIAGQSVLSSIIGIVNFSLSIWYGVKGNEWAWRNRHFDSVDQFRRVQRAWFYWGLGFFIFFILLIILGVVLFAMIAARK